jgi:hypothetical protein
MHPEERYHAHFPRHVTEDVEEKHCMDDVEHEFKSFCIHLCGEEKKRY